MKDWKGNEIQVGQTVLRINFKSMFGGNKSRFGFIFTDANGKQHYRMAEEFISDMEYQWTIQDRFLITEPSNVISISFSSEVASKTPINISESWMSPQPWQVLAIEGISDNEEEFFKEYFK